MTRLRRRLQLALAVLLIIGLVVDGAVLILFARSQDAIRGDFCTYIEGMYHATLRLPQVPARLDAERNDLNLMRQLGCPRKGP
jgi:hypothetical protein